MKFKKVVSALLAFAMVASLAACGAKEEPAAAETEETTEGQEYGLIDGEWVSYKDETKPVVRLSNNEWGHTYAWNWIQKIIYEEGLGYPTEEVFASNVACMEALINDEADVHTMIWDTSLEGYADARDAGKLTQVGTLAEGAVQGVVVPRYVVEGDKARGIEAVAPDLKTVKDLAKYADLFTDPEDPSKGAIYNADPSYLAHTVLTEKFYAYGLDEYYNLVECAAPAKTASLKAAYEQGIPWVGYGSMPNIEFNACDCILLEDEPYDPALFTEEAHYTCAWAEDDIVIATSNSMAEKAPEVVDFLSKWTLGQEVYNNCGAIVKEVCNDDDGYRCALFYLTTYPDQWKAALSADAAQRVQDYLDYLVPTVTDPTVEEVINQAADTVEGFTGK